MRTSAKQLRVAVALATDPDDEDAAAYAAELRAARRVAWEAQREAEHQRAALAALAPHFPELLAAGGPLVAAEGADGPFPAVYARGRSLALYSKEVAPPPLAGPTSPLYLSLLAVYQPA